MARRFAFAGEIEGSSRTLSQVSRRTDSISSLVPCDVCVSGIEEGGCDVTSLEQGLQSFLCGLLFEFSFFSRAEVSVSFCGLNLVENGF